MGKGDQGPMLSREDVRAGLMERLGRTAPAEERDPVRILLRVEGMRSLRDLGDVVDSVPRRWCVDGRPLTQEELRMIREMQPTDFLRYHLAQEERREGAVQSS